MQKKIIETVNCYFDGKQPIFAFNAGLGLGQHVCQTCFCRSPLAVTEAASAINWDLLMKSAHTVNLDARKSPPVGAG